VGEIKPDGSLDRSACGSYAPSGGAGGLSASQQMQLQGAQAIGAAIGAGLVNMFRGDPNAELQKQQLKQQQDLLEQQRRQEAAEKKRQKDEAFRKTRDQTVQGFKGEAAPTGIADPRCDKPSQQEDGSTWKTCVAPDGHPYCEVCNPGSGLCQKTACYRNPAPLSDQITLDGFLLK